MSITRQSQDFLRYTGCVQGTHAYTGPKRAEIYLTNKCNLDCIACWDFSPLLKPGQSDLEMIELDWRVLSDLIDDLAEGGCEQIQLLGNGEPMMYPKVMEAMEKVKALGMECYVTSNMTPITERRADRMVEWGIDRLYVSLWAATPETYSATHPKSSQADFLKIDKILRHFKDRKAAAGTAKPEIIIHNVIFNLNCHEVRKMVDYALEVGATAVQFTMVYTLPDSTDSLLMDQTMVQSVRDQLDSVPREVYEKTGHHGPGSFLWEIEIFKTRLGEPAAVDGNYDRPLLETIPCQLGWFHTIIRTNGDVIPCCKGRNKPMGNLHDRRFRDVWQSDRYDEFRYMGKHVSKEDPYFHPMNCYKMCDNVGMLLTIESHMDRLRKFEGVTRSLVVPVLEWFEGKASTDGSPSAPG